MPGPTLRALLSPRSGSLPALKALLDAANADICIFDPAGKGLLGVPSTETPADYARVPVQFEDATLGFVTGPSAPATAVALLLMHLAARESEGRIYPRRWTASDPPDAPRSRLLARERRA